MFVDFNILNQLGSPSINSNTFANRPSAGQVGRLFVSTDTFEIYRDTGTGWDLIGGPGSSTVTGSGAAGQVTYWTGTNSVGGENNLWWDAANNRFGVNTNTPTAAAEVVQTDGVALYSNFTTNAGSGPGTTAILAKNTTNSSGYAAVIEENTPNVSAGQYPVLIRHTLSSGTAAANMATGIHFGLPDDAGTERINQFSMDTVDAAAATYSSRYRFLLRNNGSAVTPLYITGTGLGVFTATPGAALDIHSTGVIAQFNTTSGTGNVNIAFQRTGTGVWRMGDSYNGGLNFFELHNTVLGNNALQVSAATNKTTWQATENYTSGIARGNYFDYNLTINPANPLASPNAITALGASLDLTLQGSVTIPSGARSGLDAYNSIGFTTTGTLTQNQGSQLRTYSNLTTGWAFNGTQTGTITHLSGIHVRFPDNTGSAMAITNNYGVLINDQTANTGTVTYTNRWGLYQEGASDLNYMAANLLLGSTTNSGEKLQVIGYGKFWDSTQGLTIGAFTGGAGFGAIYAATVTPSNINHSFAASSGATILNVATGGVIDLEINTASALYIDTNRNIGIGTIAPNNRLTVGVPTVANTVSPVIRVHTTGVYSAGGSAGAGGSIQFGQYYDTYPNWILGQIASTRENTAWGGNLLFYTNDNSAEGAITEKMRITSAGLVNVLSDSTNSTFTSGGTLALKNAASEPYLSFHNNTGGRIGYLQMQTSGTAYLALDVNQALDFYTNGLPRTRLTAGGNFLIGTTTDAGQKLQVSGDINVYNSINGGIITNASGKTFIASSGETELYLRHTVISGVTTCIANFANVTTGDPMLFQGNVRSDGTNSVVYLGDITAYGNATTISIDDAASTISTSSSNIDFNGLTSSVSAGSLVGYITIKLNGTSYKIPYYNL
jgi:hypothetical protein